MSDEDRPIIRSNWPRLGCLRITFPDDGTPKSRHEDPVPLAPIISELFGSGSSIRRLEILSWPGEDQQEWILYPEATTAPSLEEQREQLENQAKPTEDLGDFGTGTSAERDEPKSVLGRVQNVCEEVLPADFGHDHCDVDFSPIEHTIRPTCRLVVRESADHSPLARKKPHSIYELVKDLNDQDLPYIFQTIITSGGKYSDYQLTQRLAVYPPNYGIGVERDFMTHIEEGPKVNLSEYYDPGAKRVQSNFDIEGTDYFTVDPDKEGGDAVKKRHKHGDRATKHARRILEGKRECLELYRGYHDTDKGLENLYRDINYYSSIALDAPDLPGFVALVPDYITHSPWEAISYANPPKIYSNPDKIAKGTEAPHVRALDISEETFVTQGSDQHRRLEKKVENFYKGRGFTVERLDTESTNSVPDLRIRKDGTTYLVEVENKGVSRPANVLTNAARAAHHGLEVIFVTKNKSAAKSLVKILRHPVKDHIESGAQLYTQSSALTLADGGKPLLPADSSSSESIWYLSHDGELWLESNNRTIASGDPETSVSEWHFETDIIPDGEAVPKDRTRIHPPFVPGKISYLKNTEVRYENAETLTLLEKNEYDANWNYTDAEGKRKRYKEAYGTFFERKTVHLPGGEIPKGELRTVFSEEFYRPQTSRKKPGDGESGRAMREHVEQKSRNNNYDHYIKDRVWRWPRGINSPDLPFVGGEGIVFDEWDD